DFLARQRKHAFHSRTEKLCQALSSARSSNVERKISRWATPNSGFSSVSVQALLETWGGTQAERAQLRRQSLKILKKKTIKRRIKQWITMEHGHVLHVHF